MVELFDQDQPPQEPKSEDVVIEANFGSPTDDLEHDRSQEGYDGFDSDVASYVEMLTQLRVASNAKPQSEERLAQEEALEETADRFEVAGELFIDRLTALAIEDADDNIREWGKKPRKGDFRYIFDEAAGLVIAEVKSVITRAIDGSIGDLQKAERRHTALGARVTKTILMDRETAPQIYLTRYDSSLSSKGPSAAEFGQKLQMAVARVNSVDIGGETSYEEAARPIVAEIVETSELALFDTLYQTGIIDADSKTLRNDVARETAAEKTS